LQGSQPLLGTTREINVSEGTVSAGLKKTPIKGICQRRERGRDLTNIRSRQIRWEQHKREKKLVGVGFVRNRKRGEGRQLNTAGGSGEKGEGLGVAKGRGIAYSRTHNKHSMQKNRVKNKKHDSRGPSREDLLLCMERSL